MWSRDVAGAPQYPQLCSQASYMLCLNLRLAKRGVNSTRRARGSFSVLNILFVVAVYSLVFVNPQLDLIQLNGP